MGRFKSGIITKYKVLLTPEGNESHSDLLESHSDLLEDIRLEAAFVRAELVPPDGNRDADIGEWEYIVDQDNTPDWYRRNPEKYEADFRAAVKEYLRYEFVVICGYACTPIKNDVKGTYYLVDRPVETHAFGRDNNYAVSDVRERLANSDLAKKLIGEFGDRLVPITLDLLTLDGLDDFGVVEGDVLAIPTLDLYRECRKRIPNSDSWWWLATPHSTHPTTYVNTVETVRGDGMVGSGVGVWYEGGIRPFFIIKS